MDGDEDKFCQPRVSKKFNKCDEERPRNHQSLEIDVENQNPFQIQVILDVVFKLLSFEDVKKFRQVSSTWNQVGASHISRRHQKPINFHDLEDLGLDDKLGHLVQLKKRHNQVFGFDSPLFTNFSINISLLDVYNHQNTRPIFDIFLDFFTQTFVQFYRSLNYPQEKESSAVVVEEENENDSPPHLLCKFLIKISPTIREIDFDNFFFEFKCQKVATVIEELLKKTRFPHLRKITNNFTHNIMDSCLQEMFFYTIIGQNSPKLSQVVFGSSSFFGINEEELDDLKGKFESSGLIPKLKTLDLVEVRKEVLGILAEFSIDGQLKLVKLNFQNYQNPDSEDLIEHLVCILARQGDSLKILKMTTPDQITMDNPPNIRVPFPTLQNLTLLQIDYFSSFQTFFEPINFSLQFPKLEEFRTFDLDTFLEKELGVSGDSIKSVSFLKKLSNNFDLSSDKVYKTFPNLEFLEVDCATLLPLKFSREIVEENVHFWWSQLKRVRIHCNKLEKLYDFGVLLGFLKDVKKIELVMNCGNSLAFEDSYKKCLLSDELIHANSGPSNDLDHYKLDKLYRKCLTNISEIFSSIIHLTSISFIGYEYKVLEMKIFSII